MIRVFIEIQVITITETAVYWARTTFQASVIEKTYMKHLSTNQSSDSTVLLYNSL